MGFLYFGQEVNNLTSLNLYNGSIFICDKWIVPINNQKGQRMIYIVFEKDGVKVVDDLFD